MSVILRATIGLEAHFAPPTRSLGTCCTRGALPLKLSLLLISLFLQGRIFTFQASYGGIFLFSKFYLFNFFLFFFRTFGLLFLIIALRVLLLLFLIRGRVRVSLPTSSSPFLRISYEAVELLVEGGQVVEDELGVGPVVRVDGPAEGHHLVQVVGAVEGLSEPVTVTQVLGHLARRHLHVGLLRQGRQFPQQHAVGPLEGRNGVHGQDMDHTGQLRLSTG